MAGLLVAAGLLILGAVPALAQTQSIDARSGWVWQNPVPQGNNLNSVFMLDSQNIFAVGNGGRFMKSSDGGATWTVNSIGVAPLEGIFCSDVNICNALSVDGSDAGGTGAVSVYQTKDGGNTWTGVGIGTSQVTGSMSCTDANTCAVAFGSTVVRTTNGWVTQTSQTLAPNVQLFGISCTDFNTCTIGAGAGRILRTTDGGNTWNTVYNAPNEGDVTAMSCADDNTCTALESFGVLRTTDGGATWAFSYWVSQPLTAIVCPNVNSCTAVGNGQIVQTFDGGSTWNQQSNGLTPDVDSLAVACAGSNACVAGGKLGSILQTTDGTDWARRDRAVTRDGINAVSCVDANTCTAVGPVGAILRTINAGATWSPQPVPATLQMSAISCPDDSTCTAVGRDTATLTVGETLHTKDGGNTWTQQSSAISKQLFAVSCTDANTCTAVGNGGSAMGNEGIVVQTRDGGTTWTQSDEVLTNGGYLLGVACVSSNTCIVVGWEGLNSYPWGASLILRTADGGTTWTEQTGDLASLGGISCPDANTCVAIGGGVLRSTDAGAHWTLTENTFSGNSVTCGDANTCVELGGGPTGFAGTTDGGYTWTPLNSNGASLDAVSCGGANTCTTVGSWGAILRSSTPAQNAGVTFDSSVSSGFQWGVSAATTPTLTVGNGANRAAMIMVAMDANNATGITASLGGVTGTLVPGTDSGTAASLRTLIFCVVNPPSGSQTATVSWTGAMDADVGVIAVSGADQTTPCTNGTFAATNSDQTATPSVTITSNPGDLTASVGFTGDAWATPFTNQTLKWGVDGTEVAGDIGSGAGTTTHTWTDQYLFQMHSVSGANFQAAPH